MPRVSSDHTTTRTGFRIFASASVPGRRTRSAMLDLLLEVHWGQGATVTARSQSMQSPVSVAGRTVDPRTWGREDPAMRRRSAFCSLAALFLLPGSALAAAGG